MIGWLAACAQDDYPSGWVDHGWGGPVVATGSATLTARGDILFGASAWDGTVTRTTPGEGSVEVAIGGEPTRLTWAGDRLWVTLRAERSVVVLDPELTEVDRIEVGAEPYGVLASVAGDRVYVALSQADEVVELNGADGAVLRRWPVHDEPRWLARHPSGRRLYVAHGLDGVVTAIDLVVDGVVAELPPPEVLSGELAMDVRATGNPAVSPTGDALVVPMLYTLPTSEGEQPSLVGDQVIPPTAPPYYVTIATIGRLNPALGVWALAPHDGEPAPPTEASANPTAWFLPTSSLARPVRGYAASAAFVHYGMRIAVPIEGSDSVVLLTRNASPSTTAPGFEEVYALDVVTVDVAGNPSAIAVDSRGRPWVHERGTRTVAALSSDALQPLEGWPQTFHADDREATGTVALPADVEEGRALFWSGVDRRIALPGGGVSCATCHVDGRVDGLTWAFDGNPRQTPSLVGGISETLPVTWTDAIPTVEDEVLLTSIGRMGGVLPREDAELVVRYLDTLRPVDVADRGSTDPLVLEGEASFTELGCAECHAGPHLTDGLAHDVGGLPVDTPSLLGVSATPPYFHDGRAPTLEDAIVDPEMRPGAPPTPTEVDALAAFLRTL